MSILAPPLSGDPLSIVGSLPHDRAIGALWRRLVAFGIDGVIVGVVANVIAIPFFEAFSHLGPWGRLLGFCMALPYFVILNSSIGNGQTLGKRWMHVQVVDARGNPITVGKSLIRYAIFAIPYYLDDVPLPVTRTPWVLSSLISVVVFAVGGATLYLVFFNRNTRQGIHDLAVGSYVVEADRIGPPKTQEIWRWHWVILGALLLVLPLVTRILGDNLAKWGPIPQLLQDVRLIENMDHVQQAGAQDLNWSNWGGDEKKKILVINVRWTGKAADEEAFADRVAKLILQGDSSAQEHDLLRVVMIRGYDLGIAHAQVSRSFEHTPAEWTVRFPSTMPAENVGPTKL